MLTPRHKGRGRWVVMDGDREVAGPFNDKDAAIGWIDNNTDRTAPELGAALAKKTAQRKEAVADRADFLSEREASRLTDAGLRDKRERFLADLLEVVLLHAGEDAAARCEAELRAIAADPKREAKRRLRLREMLKHGQQLPAMTLDRVPAA